MLNSLTKCLKSFLINGRFQTSTSSLTVVNLASILRLSTGSQNASPFCCKKTSQGVFSTWRRPGCIHRAEIHFRSRKKPALYRPSEKGREPRFERDPAGDRCGGVRACRRTREHRGDQLRLRSTGRDGQQLS